ncbi:putative Calcium/calmodulin-dependent protein kinase [Rubrivivax sp. A210]|uniref:serine/threonine-protein kinase n=1 Tax=Rubrivivax sp. A210 TaxID=2772301 RepID=UPI001919177C|nr:serine/threonine-protein kinase [Rubrivivax sp. A210]CAD5372866.1 putative Calcium/calmodulin-dependent protein kinase [Rubrivivax sp. A210]
MNDGCASLDLDRRALALLERLLDSPAPERSAELQGLRTTDPALQLRVQRLLEASDDGEQSRALAAPLLAGLHEATRPRLKAGDLMAGWRLLRPLGQGGMAVVWLAERAEGGLKREVAIKLPLAAQLSGVLADRFARERDVLAALDHPNIARLLDAGTAAGGQPYLVLEYAAGQAITAAAQGLGLRQRLQLFQQVLAAVDHAHRHLVVHRDIKPSNIVVNAEGQVKLLDFGIAKLLDAPAGSAALTQDAGAVLTPRYAAPEQVLGQPISTATDIYSAGVVLYELLTGRLPHGDGQGGLAQVMQAVAQDEAQPPGISQDIDTVLLKALRKAPQDRYASVERFAEDLRRVLADEPILARRVPWWQRARLRLRRHRGASAAAACAAALLVGAGGLAWHQARESAAQKARGDAVRDFVFSMISDAEPAAGRNEVTGKELLDAAVLRVGSEFADQPRLRGELLGELGRVYFRLQQTEASTAALQQSVALLQALAKPDDPALNRSRAVLALSLMNSDGASAAALAQRTLDDCPGQPCALARAHARYALSAIASWHGESAQALIHARAMVEETETAHGSASAQLAPALETLALTARNAAQLPEAAAAIQRARGLPEQATMKTSSRNRMDLTQAVLDFDLGRHDAARTLLATLLAREAPPTERSIQWRMLSGVELAQGRTALALSAAQQAWQVLLPGPATAVTWFARQAWAQAASRAAHHEAALQAYAEAGEGLAAAQFPPGSPPVMNLRRGQAEALLRAGRDHAGTVALRGLAADHERARPPQTVESARTLDALGCAAALAGHNDEALRHHAEASARYGGALPAEHPLRLRNEVLRALANGADAAAAGGRWRETLAADSPLRQAAWDDCRALI